VEKKVTKFIIMSQLRSGSTFFADLFMNHPSTGFFGKNPVINDHFEILFTKKDMTAKEIVERAFLGNNSSKVSGCKVLWYHRKFGKKAEEIFEILREMEDLKVVFLYRQNTLRVYLSHKMALLTGRWKSTGQEDGQNFTVEFSPRELLSVFSSSEYSADVWLSMADSFFGCHNKLFIKYEDLDNHLERDYNKVCAFLGIEGSRSVPIYNSNLVKQVVRPLREVISNFDSLVEFFEGTEYVDFFIE